MALMMAPALKPAATASSVPAAMSTGLPSFTPATTMAPGASMRLRTTSHILRIWPPSRTSVRAMMTGYPAGAS